MTGWFRSGLAGFMPLPLCLALLACGQSSRPSVAEGIKPPTPVAPGEPIRMFASTVEAGNRDSDLLPQVVQMQAQGCDPLDPAHCLYPFPNNQFTTPAVADCPQDAALGGTGLRVNFNLAGMPHSSFAWVMELQNRAADGLWAKMKWTDEGRALVTTGKYKFISPVWEVVVSASPHLTFTMYRPKNSGSFGRTFFQP